jgi:hypothetical protein
MFDTTMSLCRVGRIRLKDEGVELIDIIDRDDYFFVRFCFYIKKLLN